MALRQVIAGRSVKRRVAAVAIAALAATGGGVAAAETSATTPSNAMATGMGVNEFGNTGAYYRGIHVGFTYTHGFYCDTSVSSYATSGCEAGANFTTPPAQQFDPLYITVPLGFGEGMNMEQCPANLVCVDHPGTIDLTRLEPALKPLYPKLTDAQLTEALKNFAVPEHNHFITDLNRGKPEWWPVKIIGVTNRTTYNNIRKHKSYAYIENQIKAGNKSIVGPIDTNLFLYFGVH